MRFLIFDHVTHSIMFFINIRWVTNQIFFSALQKEIKFKVANLYEHEHRVLQNWKNMTWKTRINLTLRRPLRHSWRIGLFFSSHGSALTAIPKRWKNIPHKSSTADFLKLFILMQGACGTDKTRLKILESDFTYYGVYSFWTFCVCLNFFCSITQKQVLKHL